MTIHYRIQPCDSHAHLFEVTVSITDPNPEGQVLSLPNWIPGSYMIRDFSRNIVQLEAYSGDQPVVLERIDKSCWCAPAELSQITVRYQVYAWDLSVRAAHLDNLHAFFNGTSVYLGVGGQEHTPFTH